MEMSCPDYRRLQTRQDPSIWVCEELPIRACTWPLVPGRVGHRLALLLAEKKGMKLLQHAHSGVQPWVAGAGGAPRVVPGPWSRSPGA